MRLSQLLGAEVVTENGDELGRVHDVRVRRRAGSSPDRVDQQWRVKGLVVGKRGLAERIGLTAPESSDPTLGHDLIPWDAVLKVEPDERVVTVRQGTEPE